MPGFLAGLALVFLFCCLVSIKFDQLPDTWPHNLETGRTAKYRCLGMSFEEIRQQVQGGQFTSDARPR